MINSMTGFGRGESDNGKIQFVVEMKSVNHRYNDIVVKLPRNLKNFEERIKREIKKEIKRGRVEVYVSFENLTESENEVKLDINLARAYKEALEKLSSELNLNDEVTIDKLLKFQDILKLERKEDDEEEIWNVINDALKSSVEVMKEMRETEGEQLKNDIIERSLQIEETISKIESIAHVVVMEYKEKLYDRIKELLEDKYEVDQNRLANEVAYISDKSNITEEIVRMKSHIKQLRETLNSSEAVGRKLDFLMQEMNREANTIGSKVSSIEITNMVIDIKSELEKIREQVQNIE